MDLKCEFDDLQAIQLSFLSRDITLENVQIAPQIEDQGQAEACKL